MVSTGQYWSWLAQLVVLRSGLCAACDEPCARLGLRRSCEGTSQKSLKLMSLQTTLKGEQSSQCCSHFTRHAASIHKYVQIYAVTLLWPCPFGHDRHDRTDNHLIQYVCLASLALLHSCTLDFEAWQPSTFLFAGKGNGCWIEWSQSAQDTFKEALKQTSSRFDGVHR